MKKKPMKKRTPEELAQEERVTKMLLERIEYYRKKLGNAPR
jgi:hypothetical protein